MRTAVLFLAACSHPLAPVEADLAASRAALATCAAWGGTVSGVTFSDEEATNAIDLADNGTDDELKHLAGVSPPLARDIVAAGPFGTAADPLAALDAVPGVDATVLAGFRDDAYGAWCALDDRRQACCVEIGCEGLGGTQSNVTYTDDEAHAALDWANRGTTAELEAVCQIGPTVAMKIEDARPIHSLLELDLVPYVSAVQLRGINGTTTCPIQGDVFDEWCSLAQAECTCDLGCPDATLTAWDPWRDDVPDDVEDVIDTIPPNHPEMCGPASGTPFFTQVTLDHADDCSTTWYDVIYQQDVDDGFSRLITVRIASDLHWEVTACDVI